MTLVDLSSLDIAELESHAPFPPDVEFVISALEATPRPDEERRLQHPRVPYRVRALIKLFSDLEPTAPTLLYTRHVNSQAVGFLCERRLPLSHGGIMRIAFPDRAVRQVSCTVLRCREAAPGWYEGAMYFNREQACFSATAMGYTEA